MAPKSQATKAKIDKWEDIKLKKLCTIKEEVNKVKMQPTKWENICNTCKTYVIRY